MLGADRDLGRDDVHAEGRLERFEGLEEVGALAVEHVHEDEAGEALVRGALPEALGVDLDAGDGVHDDHGRVDDPERGQRVGDEARVARRVDQVDLAVVKVDRGDRRVDRHLALLLVRLVVADRRPLDDRAQAVDLPGLEQDRLGEAGLATAAVPDEGDVSDPVWSPMAHRPGI